MFVHKDTQFPLGLSILVAPVLLLQQAMYLYLSVSDAEICANFITNMSVHTRCS